MPFDNPQQADPIATALGQMIVESINREANLRAQLIVAQAQIASLQEAAVAPAAVTPPAKASRAA